MTVEYVPLNSFVDIVFDCKCGNRIQVCDEGVDTCEDCGRTYTTSIRFSETKEQSEIKYETDFFQGYDENGCYILNFDSPSQ